MFDIKRRILLWILIFEYKHIKNLYQKRLDSMRRQANHKPMTVLKYIGYLLGKNPEGGEWLDYTWATWSEDNGCPWRADLANIVVNINVEIQRQDDLEDIEIERVWKLEQSNPDNMTDDQLFDMGMIRCKRCGHILTFGGGDWYYCSDQNCDCKGCVRRVSEGVKNLLSSSKALLF